MAVAVFHYTSQQQKARRMGAIVVVVLVMTSFVLLANGEECGMWLGPSPIKEAEARGWGHSMFTGKFIPKGTRVLSEGPVVLDEGDKKILGDLFVPVYDWEHLDAGTYAMMQHAQAFDLDDDHRNNLDLDTIQGQIKDDPPIFNMLWNGDFYERHLLQSYEGMRAFLPGLADICPCAAEGFNLEQVQHVTYRDWRDVMGDSHDESPPSPQAGSFSYLSNAMFVAARDILPGEELIVECSDNSDHFDPTKYPVVKFEPKEEGGYSICLDDKVEVRMGDHTPNVAGSHGGQRGLFAKTTLAEGTILTSSPMIPVHRDEMMMDRKKYAELYEQVDKTSEGASSSSSSSSSNNSKNLPPKKEQLLLNYMFGHPESSLLWLPNAPLILAANHAPYYQKDKLLPNAKLQWHQDKYTEAQAKGKPLTRRQEFHHAELLEMDSLEVVTKHGMGLMVDLVATRPIQANEEILIDYGKAWDDAWKQHTNDWGETIDAIKAQHAKEALYLKELRKIENREEENLRRTGDPDIAIKRKHKQKHVENAMTAIPLSSYVTADDYNTLHATEDLLTVSEQYQNPYPSNLETACYFENDWLDDEINEDVEAELITYESWYNQANQFENCLLPCIIVERRDHVPGEEAQKLQVGSTDDDYTSRIHQEKLAKASEEYGGSQTPRRYTAKLLDTHEENTSISFDCHIYKRFEYYYMDIPREGIVFVDRPHSTDLWIEQAFRQPIGLPDEMVPSIWRDKSRRKGMRGSKPKKNPPKAMTEKEQQEEEKYQASLKKWNDIETRRVRLEDYAEKRVVDTSARTDL